MEARETVYFKKIKTFFKVLPLFALSCKESKTQKSASKKISLKWIKLIQNTVHPPMFLCLAQEGSNKKKKVSYLYLLD